MSSAVREAALRLRRRPRRALLAAAGILAASAMLGTAATVAYGLATGFDRAAERADLPDVLASFDPQPVGLVAARVRALPNVAAASFRQEFTGVSLAVPGHDTRQGAIDVLRGGRRGYAVVAGRDVRGDERAALVERGVAREWHVRVGDSIRVGALGPVPVVGITVTPSDVAFPLTPTARIYLSPGVLERRFGPARRPPVNQALLWTRDSREAPVTLAQARATSAGIGGLTFVTRSGVRVLIDGAGGIVIALLVAVSLVALVAAGTMLAASWRAEVQRRLPSVGVRRALGFGPGHVAALHGAEGALVAAPAAAVGLAAGALLAAGPSGRLLAALNELGPGAALLAPLAGVWLAVVVLVAAAAAWPAWRAAKRSTVALLRGGDAPARPGRGRGGLVGLGARLVAARRARLVATVAVLAASAGFVALLLSLGSLLDRLEHDPGSVGKRYQLSVHLSAGLTPSVAAIPGVAAAAPRTVVQAADSFDLGEIAKVIAYPGDHTRFEAPPLARGRRERGPGEAEVGVGLAEAFGVDVGATLALQLPDGGEVRYRVVGVDRALDNDGRVAYVRPDRVDGPGSSTTIAVRLRPGANEAAVRARLTALGVAPDRVGGATSSSAPFLGAVAALVRAIAGVDGAVCFFALVQALALAARERRSTLAILRAVGAGRAAVARVFAGAALVLVVPAAVLGLVLERVALAPAVEHLAAGYAALPLTLTTGQVALVAGGLATLALAASLWAAARSEREPIVAGLRDA